MKGQKKNGSKDIRSTKQHSSSNAKQNLFKSSNSHGITLVALVVSIVVMLVLAGVSINAVVGDNGIITQAQSATYATSRAVLEEWLNQLYVENYDEFSEYATELYGFTRLESEYSVYFYIPKRDADGVSLSYVVDSNDNALYLINKSKLPAEIKSQLAGGDAGDGSYSSYASLTDVYGVTSDLKVYYCSAGLSTILGATEDDLDVDNPQRPITLSNELGTLLGTGTSTTAEALRTIKTLTIDSTSGLSSLKELYNLTSLQELTLNNVSLSLAGIENCSQLSYLCFQNYTSDTITNYDSISKTTKLVYLYLIKSCDKQVSNVFIAMKGIDYNQLKYLGIYDGSTYVTDISPLEYLSTTTKTAIEYLYLYSNNLTSLSSLSGFTNVTELKVYSNANLTTLEGIGNMSSLIYLYASSCNLGYNEKYDSTDTENYGKNSETDSLVALSNKASLKYVDLRYNKNLKWVSYLNTCPNITHLYLLGCSNIVVLDLAKIQTILKNCGGNSSIPSELTLATLDEDTTVVDLSRTKFVYKYF